MQKRKGIGVSPGVAMGKLLLIQQKIEQEGVLFTKNPAEERLRFRAAQQAAAEALEALCVRAEATVGRKEAEIFSAQAMLVTDPDFTEAVETLIAEERYCAKNAVRRAGETFHNLFWGLEDETLRARAADIDDIVGRVVRILEGGGTEIGEIKEPCVLYARDFSPSETVLLDPSLVLALLMGGGSKNSHSAILARTLGIPAIAGLEGQITEEFAGQETIVDAQRGEVLIGPDEAEKNACRERIAQRRREAESLKQYTERKSVTKDGAICEVAANIASPEDMPLVLTQGAEGVGLFRTEFLYLDQPDFPSEEAQFSAYRTVLEQMRGWRVVIRTMDIGADKQLPYFPIENEENPALGLRAIRLCFARRDLFETQLRALLRASAYGKLAVMFPMIASPDEVRRARQIAEECRRELEARNVALGTVEWGVMIETPAAAVMSDLLAKKVDFFSIGTNDLTQYTLAADRMNGRVADYYREADPAILRLIQKTVTNAHAAGIWVGVCGELASDEACVPTLLAFSVDELSVPPAAVLKIRKLVCETNAAEERRRLASELLRS